MADSHVDIKRDGSVVTLVHSNPPLHTINALGSQQLFECLERLAEDRSVRVVVITGASKSIFVRHYEVGELASTSERVIQRRLPLDQRETRIRQSRVRGGLREAMTLLESMTQMTIAAMNGMAHGGGLELALACDFRLVREGEFTFGLPETGVGILPGGGGTQRLARIVGVAKALDLILHGSTFGTKEALELGIVSRVLPNPLDQYHKAVAEFAQNLARRAPIALANSKRAIREGIEMSLADGLRHEAKLFAELMATKDAARALRAVADGKPIPRFEGD